MTVYKGRFAPSPTGKLHMGSLLAAVASYADAKHNNGLWALRIDDIDQPRVLPSAEKDILLSLESLGFEWEGIVHHQNNHNSYDDAITKLLNQQQLYSCTCRRKQIKAHSMTGLYEGTCSDKGLTIKDIPQTYSLRLRTQHHQTQLVDRNIPQTITEKLSIDEDFIIQRSDKIISYQLASVIDDAHLHINHIVRGYDLIESSLKQVLIHQLLDLPIPSYLHLPVLVDEQGIKLSKRSFATPITNDINCLYLTAKLLGQKVDDSLKEASIKEFWDYLIKQWDIGLIPKCAKLIC